MPAAENARREPRGDQQPPAVGGQAQAPPRVRSSRTGMRFDPLMPLDGWKALGVRIAVYSDASAWWLGDWLAFGQMKYGRRYKEGIALTGLEYQTLRNYAVVARRFALSRRRNNVSFQHHSEVCALGDEDQDFWLDLAADEGWSKSELRRRLRAVRYDPMAGATASARSACSALRLVLEPQRELRWREAASRDHCSLEAWITRVLDDAAGLEAEGDGGVVVVGQSRRRGWAPSRSRRRAGSAGQRTSEAPRPLAHARLVDPPADADGPG
jgi:hypothetical protein